MKELENALSLLQCTLVAQRAYYVPEPITWSQYNVLEVLRLNGDLIPAALSLKLGISRQNLSKSLKLLKSYQFICQSQSKEDKRVLITCLTEKGLDFLNRASTGRGHNAEKVGKVLTVGEQALFIELSKKICSALEIAKID